MALAGVEPDTLVSEPNALTGSIGSYECSGVYVGRFQDYEYTLSEIFITCGT